MPDESYFKPVSQKVLADDWGKLIKHEYDLKLRDGSWQRHTRETYDRGNGACCILFNKKQNTIILTRQFRLPVFVNGHDGYLLEVAAGLLEGARPEKRMKQELEEETGYRIDKIDRLFRIFMSPGSVTEYLEFFVGYYEHVDQVYSGGGQDDEGEDIAVIELNLDEAMRMISNGEICDAKTVILIQHLFISKEKMSLVSRI